MGYMKDRIGEAELLCQYAEELAEEAKSALKLARIIRGINPTPVDEKHAREALNEEFADCINCSRDLGLSPDESIIRYKQKRFAQRWEEKHETD